MRRKAAPLILVVLCVFIFMASPTQTSGGSHTYSTWQYVELDKAASSWLIKRFADKEAKFRVFRKGSVITAGIPFDTPDSKLRRNRNVTTFESIQAKYRIHDPALDYIAKIVWDVEVNVWDKKTTPEASGVNAIIRGLARTTKNENECFEKSWPVFDALYAEVKSRK
jgi:hypothetical protein